MRANQAGIDRGISRSVRDAAMRGAARRSRNRKRPRSRFGYGDADWHAIAICMSRAGIVWSAASTNRVQPTTRCSWPRRAMNRTRLSATIVNYACHPTTLGLGNRLISPDYVGAMGEVTESQTAVRCACFFRAHPASSAPAEQYVARPIDRGSSRPMRRIRGAVAMKCRFARGQARLYERASNPARRSACFDAKRRRSAVTSKPK